MSRKVPQNEFEHTFSYHFRQWLNGTRDPFLDTLEMKPQKVFREDKKTVVKREKEKKALFERIYDIKNNPEMCRDFFDIDKVLSSIAKLF